MPLLPQRKSIRLKNYDYSQPNLYFITICSQDRQEIFGKIKNQKMVLNKTGELVKQIWESLPKSYPLELDVFQIMPNHIHGIINSVGAGFMPAHDAGFNTRATTRVAPTATLGNIVGSFKSIVTHEYIKNVKNKNWPIFNKRLWQRNFYEHIIRNETELNKIRKYIQENPENWKKDKNNSVT